MTACFCSGVRLRSAAGSMVFGLGWFDAGRFGLVWFGLWFVVWLDVAGAGVVFVGGVALVAPNHSISESLLISRLQNIISKYHTT